MADLLSVPLSVLIDLKTRVLEIPRIRNAYATVLSERAFTRLQEHERMLADTLLADLYHRAIERHVFPGQVALDVGTGTGLRALLLAKRTRTTVYAVDPSSVIDVARQVALANDIHNVQFQRVSSRRFAPPEKVDVIFHDQLGWGLFDEELVSTLVDLRERVLAPRGRILPARFELFVEPVQLKASHRVPFIWEQHVSGIDFRYLEHLRTVLPSAYFRRAIPQGDVEALLGSPAPLLSFDLQTVRPHELVRTLRYDRPIERNGRLDGFGVYFRACFDDELTLDTGPHAGATQWGMLLLRVEARQVRQGEQLRFELDLRQPEDVDSWRWRLA
jgi:type I protein arginine methyltransferase